MSIMTDFLLMRPSQHTILGIPVTFSEREKPPTQQQGNNFLNSICKASKVFLNTALNDNFYALLHEMGHAHTYQWFGNTGVRINIIFAGNGYSNKGVTFFDAYHSVSGWRDSVGLAMGPITVLSFITAQLLIQHKLKNVLPPVLQGYLGILATFYLTREIDYQSHSAWNNDEGDFGLIRKNGPAHLLVASTALSTIAGINFAILAKIFIKIMS